MTHVGKSRNIGAVDAQATTIWSRGNVVAAFAIGLSGIAGYVTGSPPEAASLAVATLHEAPVHGARGPRGRARLASNPRTATQSGSGSGSTTTISVDATLTNARADACQAALSALAFRDNGDAVVDQTIHELGSIQGGGAQGAVISLSSAELGNGYFRLELVGGMRGDGDVYPEVAVSNLYFSINGVDVDFFSHADWLIASNALTSGARRVR